MKQLQFPTLKNSASSSTSVCFESPPCASNHRLSVVVASLGSCVRLSANKSRLESDKHGSSSNRYDAGLTKTVHRWAWSAYHTLSGNCSAFISSVMRSESGSSRIEWGASLVSEIRCDWGGCCEISEFGETRIKPIEDCRFETVFGGFYRGSR